jgi:hypothetical protein
MKQWLRRLRGVLGIGTLWGLVGTVVGVGVGAFLSRASGQPLLQALVEFGLGVGWLGFVLGSVFAGVLTMLEGQRTLDKLTPWRAARWGALAGVAVSLSVGVYFFASVGQAGLDLPLSRVVLALIAGTGAYGALTAALAAGTVAIARRAPEAIGPGAERDHAHLLGGSSDL